MTEKIQMNGSLHSHGCWTDHRNPKEHKKFPFDLESFARLCLEIGRDFQVISEVKDHPTEIPYWWNETRYKDLMRTARVSEVYEVDFSPDTCTVCFKKENKKVVVVRGQEVVLDDPHKHVSALGVARNLQGGLKAKELLKIIKAEGGYAITNHPFMSNAWTEEELLQLYQDKLIQAAEWNGKLTFPAWLNWFFMKIGKRTPSKKSNKRVLELEKRIPVIANDDANSEDDMRKGAYTCYDLVPGISLVESIFDAIRERSFIRRERYSPLLSPVKHVFYIKQAEKLYKEAQ